MAPSQVVHYADFGYYLPPDDRGKAVIGDTVWWDINQNGTRDPGEAGIPGIDGGAEGCRMARSWRTTTVTDQNGNYLFTNVPPGTYYVDVTTPPPASMPSPAAPDPTTAVYGGGGSTVPGCRHRLRAESAAPAGDDRGHGVERHAGSERQLRLNEPGIPGVTVQLLDASGNIIATTTTDTNGDYTFKVPAGSYFVVVSDTHNVLDDYTGSPLGNQTQDSTNKQQPYPVTATEAKPTRRVTSGTTGM